ncbi:MAG: hypothetical protein FWF51_03320 [Chitinivibrionia bacterium]|nr:hypothetical protein [Chitinivibrionia bacterium]
MKKRTNCVLFGAAVAAMFFAACGLVKTLDVVGKESETSFEALLKSVEGKVKKDDMSSGYWLVSPDSQATFFWGWDYSKSGMHDLMLDIDAQPFLDAGLDPEKLPHEYMFYEGGSMGGSGIAEKLIMIGVKLGSDELKYDSSPTPLAAFKHLVNLYRGSIGYHTALDHYGVDLGDGNMFEWAKDMSTNDKDMVFVVNPEPFINAGVVPENLDGWIFTKVPVEKDGKNVEVDKFLKIFDLK